MQVWAAFSVPKSDCGTHSAVDANGSYLNHAGSMEDWSKFIIDEFIPFGEKTYHCGGEQSRRYVRGNCIGGTAAFKMAFRYPRHFGAVVAMQSYFPMSSDMEEEKLRDERDGISYYPAKLKLGTAAGVAPGEYICAATDNTTLDAKSWRTKLSLTAMVEDNADEIRESGIKIYMDVGDHDSHMLQNSNEALHRTLWYHRILHEYHLVP